MADRFVQDMEPFFYKRRVRYVDVGAHMGELFRELVRSEVRVSEAHLVEPNPASFERLQAAVEGTEGLKVLCHRLALGDEPGTVRMRASGTMTKVLSDVDRSSDIPRDDVFETQVVSLQSLVDTFVDRHISILKVDVEGYEKQVLMGAQGLLENHAIDVIYIEAGLDPDTTQQCYYREIEDYLRPFGYRIFRIYEQQHEWIDDSPFLRRVNIALMSNTFAASNPYRVTKELFQSRKVAERLSAELGVTKTELAATKEGLDDVSERLREARAANDALSREADAARQLRSQVADLEAKIPSVEQAQVLQRRIAKRDRRIRELRDRIERLRAARDRARQEASTSVPARLLAALRQGGVHSSVETLLGVRNEAHRGRRAEEKAHVVRPRAKKKPEASPTDGKAAPNGKGGSKAGATGRARDQALLREIDLYARQGNASEVKRLIGQLRNPASAEVMFACANLALQSSETEWLEHLNRAWAHYDLGGLRLRPTSEPDFTSRMKRLQGLRTPGSEGGPLVTVAMSCFNAESHLRMAMESLLNQTYADLEIIAINDCSTDNSLELLHALRDQDPRIQIRNNTSNVGTYVSRNRCLYEAQGKYFTVLDSDDYAHPERIALQVRLLERDAQLMGNMGRWVRMLEDGTIVFKRAYGGVYEHEAVATLMFRAEEARRRIGYWDCVRFAADTEYMSRIRKVWGTNSVAYVKKPLLLSLFHSASLTNHPVTGIDNERGLSPARVEYRRAWRAWHERQGTDLYLPPSADSRPFPVPAEML